MRESRLYLRSRSRASLLALAAVAAGLPAGLIADGLVTTVAASSPPRATISSVTPAQGPAAGGNQVVIAGSALRAAPGVWFGETPVTAVQAASDTSMTVTVPAGKSGTTVGVSVREPVLTEVNANDVGAYTYDGRTRLAVTPAPNHGLPAGGNSVVITGAGIDFREATAVSFGTKSAPITQRTAAAVTVQAPAAGPTDVVGISVTLSDGHVEGRQSSRYTYDLSPDPPVITGLDTKKRYVGEPGFPINIIGSGLEGATRVTVGGETVSFERVGRSLRFFTNSSHPAGTFDVSVTTPAGTNTNTDSDDFTYVPVPPIPEIDSITPNSGPVIGGTLVTVRGKNFDFVTSVGVRSNYRPRPFTKISDTEIQFVTGPGRAYGEAEFTFSNGPATGGTDPAVAGDGFTYTGSGPIPGPLWTGEFGGIGRGPTVGGEAVVLQIGFSPFSFGDVATAYIGTPGPNTVAEIVASDPEHLLLISPKGPKGFTTISLFNAAGQQINTVDDEYEYVVATPRVDEITPATGPLTGGGTVTLKGYFLNDAKAVRFGTATAGPSDITNVSDRELQVKVPAGVAAGQVEVTVETEADSPSYRTFYTYEAAAPTNLPVVTGLSPKVGLAGVGGVTTISGKNLTNVKGVRFGTKAAIGYYASGGKLFVVAPPLPKGYYAVRVTTKAGTSVGSSASTYQYFGF